MMLDFVTDLIRISGNDPLWVTIALVAARTVTFCVVVVWVGTMVRRQLRMVGRPSWPLTWPWSLVVWMMAVGMQLGISAARVLLSEHIREWDQIGQNFRMVEIAIAINLALWSIVAFWRWAHPLQAISDAGVFASLAASMSMIVSDSTGTIVYVTPAFNALAGYRNSDLIGENLVTIVPERLRDAHAHGLSRFLATGESRIIGQVIPLDLLRKDGTELPIYLALATAMVDGKPWFCGSVWRRTGMIEREQGERSVRQDEQQVVIEEASLTNTERDKDLSEAKVVLDNRRIEMNDEQTAMDERQVEQDERGKEQDHRSEEQVRRDLTIGDVIKQTSDDVLEIRKDVVIVKNKIVEEETP